MFWARRPGNAVTIIETDINVDFEAPLDHEDGLMGAAAKAKRVRSPAWPDIKDSRAVGQAVGQGEGGAPAPAVQSRRVAKPGHVFDAGIPTVYLTVRATLQQPSWACRPVA